MPHLSEAIARYHKLLEDDGYSDLFWAEKLQNRMRDGGLIESGRPVSSVLRPQFISRRQLDSLTNLTRQLASILDRVEALVLESPALLNRLQVLPAEKMLAAIPPGYSRCSVMSCMDARLQNGAISINGYQTCKPKALAYSQPLADLFLDLPLLKRFKRGRYKVSKVGQTDHLAQTVLAVWKEWGGERQPSTAVIEFRDASGAHSIEGELINRQFGTAGLSSRVLSPDQLEFSHGKLHAGDFPVDLVFRRFGTSELLSRFDLSHPLLAAYRDHAICMVNSFRSEIAHRRAFFELLTDENVTGKLPSEDRKLINSYVPWTRSVFPRKTKYKHQEIELGEFVLSHREKLLLRPNQDGIDHRTYIGAQMSQSSWESAFGNALRDSYVVQEQCCYPQEAVPVFQYGELSMKHVQVTVHPHVLEGKMNGVSAELETSASGFTTPLALAPVLLLESA